MPLQKKSHCKVNLILNILGRREDGFHELETVMHPVNLCDELDFERIGSGLELICSHPELPSGPGNLVHRAASSFLASAKISEGVRIHLRKNLPLAGGMGGGSANAAVTLTALNELFGFPLPDEKIEALAAALGSDAPFFLGDKPALATGRGEVVRALEAFPALRGRAFFLAHPGFGISTPWSYQNLARFPAALNGRPGRAMELAGHLQGGRIKAAAREFYNSLEAPAFDKFPVLLQYQEFLRGENALAALMSGSGSATFAIAGNLAEARNLEEKFKSRFGAHGWTATAEIP